MRRDLLPQLLLFLICLAALGAFLVLPIALTCKDAFVVRADGGWRFTFEYVAHVFRDPVLVEGLVNSLAIACCVTGLSLAAALPLAVLATRYAFPGRNLLSAALLVPLVLPPFVGAIGLQQLLGRYGAVNALLMHAGWVSAADPVDFLGGARFWGVVVMEALHLYPIVFLNVSAALANLDPALEEAAETLGAGRWRRFRRVVLPLILPGVFAGATIVFIWSFTELGTPLMFDYTAVTPVQIFWGIQEIDSPRPFALVFVVLVITALLYAGGRVLFGGRAQGAAPRASVAAAPRPLRGPWGLLAAAPFVAVVGLALLPHLGVVLASVSEPGAWYLSVLPRDLTAAHFFGEQGALAHPMAIGAIRNSLVYASLAVALDLALGLAIAYLAVRGRIPGAGRLLDTLAMLPLAVPGLVMAFGYVALSDELVRFLEARGIQGIPDWLRVTGESPNPILFLVIAYAVRRLPYVVRSAVAGLQQTPYELEEAAHVLGASRLTTLRRVVVPLVAANLIAGGLLSFTFAMLEVSDSLILARTREHYPITAAIYHLFGRLGDGAYVASAMGVWAMTLLALTLLGTSLLLGKRLGAVFRV